MNSKLENFKNKNKEEIIPGIVVDIYNLLNSQETDKHLFTAMELKLLKNYQETNPLEYKEAQKEIARDNMTPQELMELGRAEVAKNMKRVASKIRFSTSSES